MTADERRRNRDEQLVLMDLDDPAEFDPFEMCGHRYSGVMLGEDFDEHFLAYVLSDGNPQSYFDLTNRLSSELVELYAMRRTKEWIAAEKDDDE
jgi:hypothetical protein